MKNTVSLKSGVCRKIIKFFSTYSTRKKNKFLVTTPVHGSSPPDPSRDREGIGTGGRKVRFKKVLLKTIPRDSMENTAEPGQSQGLKRINMGSSEDKTTIREP